MIIENIGQKATVDVFKSRVPINVCQLGGITHTYQQKLSFSCVSICSLRHAGMRWRSQPLLFFFGTKYYIWIITGHQSFLNKGIISAQEWEKKRSISLRLGGFAGPINPLNVSAQWIQRVRGPGCSWPLSTCQKPPLQSEGWSNPKI